MHLSCKNETKIVKVIHSAAAAAAAALEVGTKFMFFRLKVSSDPPFAFTLALSEWKSMFDLPNSNRIGEIGTD